MKYFIFIFTLTFSLFVFQPIQANPFAPIYGRGYYQQNGSFVIAKDRSNPSDVTVVSDRFKVYHKRVYRHISDPFVRNIFENSSLIQPEIGEFRGSNSIRRDYIGITGKYEG